MIDVCGGIYFERCWEGDWDQLFGSGLRAAAALSSMGVRVRLTGYAAKDDELAVQSTARALGVQVDLRTVAQTVAFEYEHPLATPFIVPPLQLIQQGDVIQLTSSAALRFGMVDGDALVHAHHAVYDPQSAFHPTLFRSNGSTADRLAVVCNRREALLLTGHADGESAIRSIAAQDQAAVVIVKQGAQGALVYADGSVHHIPVFHTPTIWPIGSGDVFSALFAQAWALDGASPVDAARCASLATAWYCESRTFPTVDHLKEYAPSPANGRLEERPLVYLAGPFFTMMQRWQIRQARSALVECGMRVFSPLHDVGYGVAGDIAAKDIEGLEKSAGVFAICDGLDSGTLFEIGYARKLGIPVVVFVQNETEASLKMLEGSGCHIVQDFASAVYRLSWIVNG